MSRSYAVLKTLVLTSAIACTLGARGANSFSWEGDFENWIPLTEGFSEAEVKSLADGIPAAAVTDGQYAVELRNSAFGGFANMFRGPGSVFNEETQAFENVLLTELKANTTIDMDVFVPASSVEGYAWAGFYLEVEGQGMRYRQFTDISGADATPAGRSYHLTWNYKADPLWNQDANWGQINFRVQGGDTLGISLSPIYVDNFRFSGAVAVNTPGDFNGDGVVNAADYTVWRDNEGSLEGDLLNGNGDGGFIDGADYVIWSEAYGSTAASSAMSIPEPSAAILVSLGLAAFVTRRRRA